MNTTTKCTRCAGTGRLERYAHVANGACFGCKGMGTIPMATVERRQRDRARREAKREADRQARLLARMAAFAADGGTLTEWAEATTVDGATSEATRADWRLATAG